MKAEPTKEVIVRGKDVNAILVSGFQVKGFIQKSDWDNYTMHLHVIVENGERIVKLLFYKKGTEPKAEEPPAPIEKKGNVLYFPTKG